MVTIDVQETPNPLARRFMLDEPVQQGVVGRAFARGTKADNPLVDAVLQIAGVASVLTLPSSLTVSIEPDGDWTVVQPAVIQGIVRQHE